MIFDKKIIIPMTLCVLPLSALTPVLLGIVDTMATSIVEEDDYLINYMYEDGVKKLPTEKLALDLESQPSVVYASPEIYVPTVVNGKTAIIRGIVPRIFFKTCNITIVRGAKMVQEINWAYLGVQASNHLNLDVGDYIAVGGVNTDFIAIVRVVAIYEGKFDDEILVPIYMARNIMGYGNDEVNTIRIRTTDVTALNKYMGKKYNVGLQKIGETKKAYTDMGTTQELMEIMIAQGIRPSVEWALEYGVKNVRIVTYGFIAFTAILTLIGCAGIVTRALINKIRDLGILYGIGASQRTITIIIVGNVVKYSFPAAVIGALAGYGFVLYANAYHALHAFGHVLHIKYTLHLFLQILAIFVAISVAATLAITKKIALHTPNELMRSNSKAAHDLQELDNVLG